VIESAIYRLSASLSPDSQDATKANPNVEARLIRQQWDDEKCQQYADKSWREVYDMLYQQAEQEGRLVKGQAMPGEGDGEPVDSHDAFGQGQETTEDQARWQAATEESQSIVERLRGQGKTTASTIKVEMVAPEIPWITLMRDHLQQIPSKVSKSWSRVKRRPFAIRGEYIPHETGTIDALHTVCFWVDTSGSMSNDLNKCAAEIGSLLWQLNCKKLILIEYDTKVCSKREMEIEMNAPEQIIQYLNGGGGTSIRCAIEELVADEEMPDSEFPMIVLTDGGDDYNLSDHLRDYNVTWITYGMDIKSDVGRVIKV
jgi:predicted metal-dependent peptidase